MNAFRVPTFIPQDLLLIQEFVGPQPSPKEADPFPSAPIGSMIQTQDEDEGSNSSDMKDHQSEEEIAADLITVSSRASTPNTTVMRDQELSEDAMLSRSAFDEYSPYGLNYSAPGPSRPALIPHDDTYGDAYAAPHMDEPSRPAGATGRASVGVGRAEGRQSLDRSASHAPSRGGRGFDVRPEGRGRDSRARGGRGDGGHERGSGRGRGGGGYRGARQQYDGNMQRSQQRSQYGGGGDATYGNGYDFRSIGSAVPERRSLSPTSFAIARATGHGTGGGSVYPQQHRHQQYHQHQHYDPEQQYAQIARYSQMQQGYAAQYFTPQFEGGLGDYMNQGYQHPLQGGGGFGTHSMSGVQPHFNPRYASVPGYSQPAPIPYADRYGDAYTAPGLDEPSHPVGATGRAPAGVSRAEDQEFMVRSASNASSRGGRGFEGHPRGRGRDSGGRGGRERARGRGGGGDHRGRQQRDDENMRHNRQRPRYGAGDAAYSDFRSIGGAVPELRSLSPTSFAIARAASHSSGDGIIYPRHQQHEQYHPPRYSGFQQLHAQLDNPRYMEANFRVAAQIAESLK